MRKPVSIIRYMEECSSLRNDVLEYVQKKYGTEPEYLWADEPGFAVLRHPKGRWYGIIMDVRGDKLGLKSDELIDIIDIKYDPELSPSLFSIPGFLPGYHMNKKHWLTIFLDGTVSLETILKCIDRAYSLIDKPRRRSKGPQRWIVPLNQNYYDIEAEILSGREFIFKQGRGIQEGDTVYIYLAAPVSSIRYKCKVQETDIPYEYNDSRLKLEKVMKLSLLRHYPAPGYTLSALREHGIMTVRGPVKAIYSVEYELDRL